MLPKSLFKTFMIIVIIHVTWSRAAYKSGDTSRGSASVDQVLRCNARLLRSLFRLSVSL